MAPLPEEELVADATVEFKGEQFDIVRDMFCQYCDAFPGYLDGNDPIKINLDVSVEAVKQFIEACQGREFFLSVDTVYDMLDLATCMGTPPLEAQIRGWIAEHRMETYVAEFLFNLKRGNDLSDAIRAICHNFEVVMEDDLLFSVPLVHLSKMVNYDADQLKLFNFLMKCLDKLGQPASALFAGVSLANLTLEQVYTLQHTPNFDWSYLGESKGRVYHELILRSLRQRQNMDDLAEDNRKLRQLHAEVTQDLARASERWAAKRASEAESLKKTLADSVAAFDAHLADERRRFDTAVETFKRDVSEEAVATAKDYFFSSQAWKNFDGWCKLHPECQIPSAVQKLDPNMPPEAVIARVKGIIEKFPIWILIKSLHVFNEPFKALDDAAAAELVQRCCPDVPPDQITEAVGQARHEKPT